VKNKYFVEMTDTYGGEANYAWVNRFLTSAVSARGAIRKVSRETGYPAKMDYSTGDMSRYNVPGACICYFVSSVQDDDLRQYPNIKIL
jgi:hypothetical protein